MQTLSIYLKLRGRLLGRQLREIGWLRLLLLLPFLLMAGSKALAALAPHPLGRWVVPGLVLAGLASAHRQRADLRFLTTVNPAFQPWLAVEYALLALPVALALLVMGAYASAGITLLVAPLAAWAGAASAGRSTRQRPRSLLRSEAFEWVSGLRATRAGLLWPALLALAGWQQATPLGPLVALGVWLLVVLGSYGTPEPLTMLALTGSSAPAVLRRRLLLGLGYAGLTAAPFVWLLGCAGGVGAGLAVGLAWLGLVALIILTKYAFYPNGLQIRISQALLIAITFTLPGHPAYLPLLLVAAGGLWWQSQRRLRQVLGGAQT
ncbi:hypothetical protein Q5H93_02720 [Hymenobacter sp. ASUV-10]|uniref:Uncharacterized protein n=1 Tax=Hymenobacter aranciens TaxID=3063996 RepID=A0ABT9B5T8_9BACT|nr:hypothetical protein [Hymenobacter sp. ASUV-10]MDO7873631.1 hypothetical protein [Hymenobacter sp. ASUV-10]